jgi:hypothetical protein
VIVPAEVTCTFTDNFLFGDIEGALRQAQGGHRLVTAIGGTTISASDCDGTPHTVDLTFVPQEAPFRTGVALITARATIGFTDPDTGEQGFASDSQGLTEIRLKN